VENDHRQAQREVLRVIKIRIITILLRRVVSEIKLKRTDTTLDLSQKAKRAKEEKEGRNQRSWAAPSLLYLYPYGKSEWVVLSCNFPCARTNSPTLIRY